MEFQSQTKLDFWKKIIKVSIEDELNHYPNNELGNSNDSELEKKKKEDQRQKTMCFAQLASNISAMSGFGLNKEEIKSIILPLSDEYQITQENKDILFALLDNPNGI